MKKLTEKQKRILHLILTIVIMVFIFVQSAMPDYASAEESNFFVEIAESIIESVSTTEIDFEVLSTVIRKIAHFTEYLVFGACLFLTISDFFRKDQISQTEPSEETVTPNHITFNSKTIFTVGAFSWLLGTIYAITDEIHQYFVPGRACSTFDILIDSAGVACGIILAEISLYIMTKKNK